MFLGVLFSPQLPFPGLGNFSKVQNLRNFQISCTHDYHVKLRCGTVLTLPDLEGAGLSYVPCARLPNDKGELEDRPYFVFGNLWGQRVQVILSSYGRKANAWSIEKWQNSEFPGVQLMTGKPTFRPDSDSPDGFCYLTDLDIEAQLIEKYPAVFEKILSVYRTACEGTPCEVETKLDGRRLSAYAPYLDRKRYFKDASTGAMLFEVFSEHGLSRLDGRYAMLSGSVLDLPRLSREALQEIHAIVAEIGVENSQTKSSAAIPAEDENLPEGLTWKRGNKFLISTERYNCTQNHASNPTCEYRKHDDGTVIRWCWACDTGWRVVDGERRNRLVVEAPPIEVREKPSFPYFSSEECQVVQSVLGVSPDAGWHGKIPAFTTKYQYLHPLTQKFALNGQPSEVEKRRVWSTLFGSCELCGAVTAQWIDRYLLTAGSYCDGCHKDYHLGSYLELELARKLPNSIESNYHGFLGDDPEFRDFRLWQPGIMTHLGAAMSTGKSTEIYKAMMTLALQGLGKGIIAVPRVSLARFLAHYLRQRDGHRAWGLWHGGVKPADRFIGEYGAIVCLPSLPRAVQSATNAGAKRLYIAIDEVDFAYNLLSLSIEQATAVKKCLRDTLHTTGLVVSGQTESTLSLEALASELECEQVQGFYNTAKPSDGNIVMHRYADLKGKSNAVVAGTIDDVSELLSAGHNVYTFSSSRRDGDIIAELFADLNPVLYNAYTKGDKRADAILKNQKLTDSQLFIATSAACVGISILDPKARTVVTSGLVYGSLDANTTVQEFVRDRGRQGGSLHHTEYEMSLPVKPTENETASLYHEALKIAENKHSHLPEDSIKKIARAEALASLADHQIETFISHHLGTVGNMPVHQASALRPSENKIDLISECRRILIRTEREKKLARAMILLKSRNLLTSSEIRVHSNKGEMSPDQRLAHETANGYACAVGWDDKVDRQLDEPFDSVLDDADIHTAVALAESNINVEKLAKHRRGYIAVHFPNWTAYTFQTALANTESDLVDDGLGIEPTAIHDDRFRGELLQVLLDRLERTVFDVSSLATAIREVLKKTRANGRTFIGEILRGALGASEYRKARFLTHADDDRIVHWVSQFISERYPARIQKRDNYCGLVPAGNLHLRLASFQRWLIHQPNVPDGMPIDLDISFQPTELPDPNAELKNMVRFRREFGETIKSIAESLNRNPRTISKWCKGIKPPSPAQSDVLSILSDGNVWKTPDIVAHSRFSYRNVNTALKTLLNAGAIRKIKRGHYQKKGLTDAKMHAISN